MSTSTRCSRRSLTRSLRSAAGSPEPNLALSAVPPATRRPVAQGRFGFSFACLPVPAVAADRPALPLRSSQIPSIQIPSIQRRSLPFPASPHVLPASVLPRPARKSVISSRAIQRYRQIDSQAYQAQPDLNEAQALFTHQNATAALRDVGDPLTQYPGFTFIPKATNARPDLLAADDDSVAVQNEAEPKEFYASNAVLQHANGALQQANSKFMLSPKGHTLSIGLKTLSMVRPELRVPDVRAGTDIFGLYFTSVCRDFAAHVIGSSTAKHEALFQSATGPGVADENVQPDRREIDTGGGTTSTAVRNISAAMAQQNGARALNNAFERDPVPEGDTATGIAYGNALRTGGNRDNARSLGVNEYAAPAVGEGYATYTNRADTDLQGDILDYSAAHGGVPRANIWGYHFAGVVAQSEEGKDRITLENYNRGESIDAQLQAVLDHLLLNYQHEVTAALARLQLELPGMEVPLAARIDAAYKAAHIAQNQAQIALNAKQQEASNAYRLLVSSRNDSQAWFFQIYGANQGQTFHERQAGSGFFANPLTLRVGRISQDVTNLRATLTARLNGVPGLVGGAQDLPAYAQVLQNGIRQITARTTAAEAQAACAQALSTLKGLRVAALVQRAEQAAHGDGIVNEFGTTYGAFDHLIGRVDAKYKSLGWTEIAEMLRLTQIEGELQTLKRRAQEIQQY